MKSCILQRGCATLLLSRSHIQRAREKRRWREALSLVLFQELSQTTLCCRRIRKQNFCRTFVLRRPWAHKQLNVLIPEAVFVSPATLDEGSKNTSTDLCVTCGTKCKTIHATNIFSLFSSHYEWKILVENFSPRFYRLAQCSILLIFTECKIYTVKSSFKRKS